MSKIARPLAKRSGSEKRRRAHKVDTRFDTVEHASLIAAARATGLTKAGYIRALVLGSPGPRAQRAPSFDALALAKATAALNKVGSNLNQMARILNSSGALGIGRHHEITLAAVEAAASHIIRIASHDTR